MNGPKVPIFWGKPVKRWDTSGSIWSLSHPLIERDSCVKSRQAFTAHKSQKFDYCIMKMLSVHHHIIQLERFQSCGNVCVCLCTDSRPADLIKATVTHGSQRGPQHPRHVWELCYTHVTWVAWCWFMWRATNQQGGAVQIQGVYTARAPEGPLW